MLPTNNEQDMDKVVLENGDVLSDDIEACGIVPAENRVSEESTTTIDDAVPLDTSVITPNDGDGDGDGENNGEDMAASEQDNDEILLGNCVVVSDDVEANYFVPANIPISAEATDTTVENEIPSNISLIPSDDDNMSASSASDVSTASAVADEAAPVTRHSVLPIVTAEEVKIKGNKPKRNSIMMMLEPVIAESIGGSSRSSNSDYDNVPEVALYDEEELADTSVEMTPATTLGKVSSPLRSRILNMDVEATLVRTASDASFMDFGDDLEDPTAGQVRAALFISARVARDTFKDDLGFSIKFSDNKTIVISDVKQNGLLAQSPVLDGDILISVNNKSCLGMKLPGAQKLFKNLKEEVTITVQNVQGDGSLVECYIKKPDLKRKIGLSLAEEPYHRRPRLRSAQSGPIIRSLHPDGLLIDSLLNPGDQIISVNGKAVSGVASTARALARAKTHVTILAKTKEKTAMVVTTQPEEGTRSRLYDFYGVPTRARRIHHTESSCSSTYDSVKMTCNAFALVLAILAIAFPAETGMHVTSRNWIFVIVTIFTLANVPWFFRRIGSRFSRIQLICNLFVMAYLLFAIFGADEDINAAWFCAFYIPLFLLVNSPSLFLEGDSTYESDAVDGMGDTNSLDDQFAGGPQTTV